AGTAILACARLADGERAAVEHLSVEFLNRVFRVGAVLEFDERESSRAAGFAVDRQHDLRRRRDGAEVASQVGFSGAVREIANEQTDGQSMLSWNGTSNTEAQENAPGGGPTAGDRLLSAKTLPESPPWRKRHYS